KGFCIFDEMAVMIMDICIGIRDGMVAITIDGHVEGGNYFSHGCGGYDKSKIRMGGGNWLVIGQEIGGRKSRLTSFQRKLRFSLANTGNSFYKHSNSFYKHSNSCSEHRALF